MQMLLWNASMIRTAKKILRRYESLHDALPDLSKALGSKVSVPSVEHAFRRYDGGSTPRSYLKEVVKDLTPREAVMQKLQKRIDSKKTHKQGLTDIISDKVEAALAGIRPSTIKVIPHMPGKLVNGSPQEIIWAELSDVQLGTLVEAEKLGGLNEHNWLIFLRKLDAWKAGVISTIRERLTFCSVKEFIFAANGDMVEGHSIFKGQAYDLEVDVYKQVFRGAEDFAQAIAEICATFPNIAFTFHGVGGNHGRVGSYGEAPYRCNFDLVLYRFIQLRLLASRVENITCFLPDSWFSVIETWGFAHVLVHGDDVKSAGGMPHAGLQRMMGKYAQMLQKQISYVHIGHFHAEAMTSTSVGDLIVNGNWIGGSTFSKQITEANVPVQLIHTITEANGIESTRKIFLRTRLDMRPKITVHKHGAKGTR